MKKKSIIAVAIAVLAATILFSACNKKNDGHTGLHVFVTDENGQTVLDKNGQPLTEEWITKVEYATDDKGETYTNANGEKVTVKQTRPSITKVIEESAISYDKDGNRVTDKNGEYVWVPRTEVISEIVTDKNGKPVTQAVTDKNGENVTDGKGTPVTEAVTEQHTEVVTRVVNVVVDEIYTQYASTSSKDKTTAIYENPKYTATDATTKSPVNNSLPQSGQIVATKDWLKSFGGSANDKFVRVCAINSSTYVALGNTESVNGSLENLGKKGFYSVLVKYDASGKILWKCALGSTGHTRIYDIAVLKDGSIIAVGESNAKDLGFDSDGTYKSIIAKVSAGGSVQWYKHIGGSSVEYFTCVAAMPDGGFVAGGKFSSKDGTFASLGLTSVDSIVSAYSADGTLKWAKKFGGSGSDSTQKIACDTEGNIYAACSTNSTDGAFAKTHGSSDVAIVKYNASGSQQWYKFLGGSKSEFVEDIFAGSGGCVFAGKYASADGDFAVNRGGYDAYMCYCSADGQIKWLRTYGGLKNDNFYGVVPTSFGYAAVGSSTSSNRDLSEIGNAGNFDGLIMSVATDGTLLHVKSVAGAGNDSCMDICKLDSKTFIIVGETYSSTGDFASLSPVASDKNCNAFVGKYLIY